jgi:hypothetical protein
MILTMIHLLDDEGGQEMVEYLLIRELGGSHHRWPVRSTDAPLLMT